MSTLNKVMLIGNLGQDPIVKTLDNGRSVARVSLATSEKWKDKDGNKQEKTQWHQIVLWTPLAELAQTYCKKGSKVYIEGKIENRKWQDDNGQDRNVTEVVAKEMTFLDSKTNTKVTVEDKQTDDLRF